jgi:hypothetical protein
MFNEFEEIGDSGLAEESVLVRVTFIEVLVSRSAEGFVF